MVFAEESTVAPFLRRAPRRPARFRCVSASAGGVATASGHRNATVAHGPACREHAQGDRVSAEFAGSRRRRVSRIADASRLRARQAFVARAARARCSVSTCAAACRRRGASSNRCRCFRTSPMSAICALARHPSGLDDAFSYGRCRARGGRHRAGTHPAVDWPGRSRRSHRRSQTRPESRAEGKRRA